MVRDRKTPAAPNSAEQRAEKRARKAEIMELLLDGVPYTDVHRQSMKKYGCTARAVERYIHEVRKELPRHYTLSERKLLAAEAIGKAEKLYARCIARGDLRTALGVLKWIGEIQGLTAAKQMADAIEKFGGRMSLRQFNEARGYFGKPPMTQEQFEQYQRGHQAQAN